MTLSVLMFGRTGQVATEILRRAGPAVAVTALGRAEADLADPAACAAAVAAHDADVVINAAAWTAVDRAESEETAATVVNAEAPGAMARACAARGIAFLHVSTDYVFDGAGERARREDDPTGPLGAYGRSKLAGERLVAAAGGSHAILRTAWVHAGHGGNFLRTMLRLGRERDVLRVVDDQRGDPTPAGAIADALLAIAVAFAAGRGVSGVFHFSGGPTVSWCDFARAILAEGLAQGLLARMPTLTPIATGDWPTPAVRPRLSALDCGRIADIYGVPRPDWRDWLAGCVAEAGGITPSGGDVGSRQPRGNPLHSPSSP